MKQNDTSALRATTIAYWANFGHARHEVDVARVHAFQALVRNTENPDTITDDQVTEAYGGRGWAPAPVCYECGARDDSNVLFGPMQDVSLCMTCIVSASGLIAGIPVKPAKTSLFTRLFKGA